MYFCSFRRSYENRAMFSSRGLLNLGLTGIRRCPLRSHRRQASIYGEDPSYAVVGLVRRQEQCDAG